jgi:hypothetical protein
MDLGGSESPTFDDFDAQMDAELATNIAKFDNFVGSCKSTQDAYVLQFVHNLIAQNLNMQIKEVQLCFPFRV